MKALLIAAALAIPVAASADDPKEYEKGKAQDPSMGEIQQPPGDLPGVETGSEAFSPDKVVNKLNKIGQKHIELGSLGTSQATNKDVKKLGEKMVKDYEKLDAEVNKYAKSKGITVGQVMGGESPGMQGGAMGGAGTMGEAVEGDDPSKVGEAGKQMGQEYKEGFEELRGLQGAEFDSKFLSMVIDNAQQFTPILSGWKGQGDKKLDKLIDRTVKLLGDHQKEAQRLQGKIPSARRF